MLRIKQYTIFIVYCAYQAPKRANAFIKSLGVYTKRPKRVNSFIKISSSVFKRLTLFRELII